MTSPEAKIIARENFCHALEGIAHRCAHGCGNHGCVVEKPKGLATNGPCRCSPRRLISDTLYALEDYERNVYTKEERESWTKQQTKPLDTTSECA